MALLFTWERRFPCWLRTTIPAAIGYDSVTAMLEALRADPSAQFREQRGPDFVASREHGDARRAVLHARGPCGASGRREARWCIERDGIGIIDLVAPCHAEQAASGRLLDDFREQQSLPWLTRIPSA